MRKQRTRVCALLASAAMVCSMTSIPASAMSADTARFIKANNAAIPWGVDDVRSYAVTLERLYYGNRPTSAISYTVWADDTSVPIDLNVVAQELADAPANPMSEYPYHGQSYAYTYDDAGHILSSSYTELPDAWGGGYVYGDHLEPYSLTSTFTYDAQGNASSRTDVGRDYDSDAAAMADVNDSYAFQTAYDSKGNLVSETDDETVITYVSDKYGRITDQTWTYPDGSTGTCHFTYKKGRLVKMAYSDADIVRTTTLTYDANKRLATALQWSGAPGDTDPEPTYYIFTYDAAGRLAEVTEHVSDGTTTYRDSWFIAYAY